jgi:hypothetical protein
MKPELEAKVKEAHAEISRMCQPGTTWRMCIPVQKGDSDMVLHDALTALTAEVNQLEAALKAKEPKPVNYLDNPVRERKYF